MGSIVFRFSKSWSGENKVFFIRKNFLYSFKNRIKVMSKICFKIIVIVINFKILILNVYIIISRVKL